MRRHSSMPSMPGIIQSTMTSAGGRSLGDVLPGRRAVVHDDDVEPPALERPAEHHRRHAVVVGNQDAHERDSPACAGRRRKHVDDIAGFDRQPPPRGVRGVHARFGADALEHARRVEQPDGRQVAGGAFERVGRRAEAPPASPAVTASLIAASRAGRSSRNTRMTSVISCVVAGEPVPQGVARRTRPASSTAAARVPLVAVLFDDGEQHRRIDRLREIAVHAGGQAPLAVAVHRVRGHRDDADVPARGALALANRDGRLEAAHHRHLQVHQHEVERLALEPRRAPRGRRGRRSPGGRAGSAGRTRPAG